MRNKTITLCMAALFFLILNGIAYPVIHSRIEGVVRDKDTKEPIKDAEIYTFQYVNYNDYPGTLEGGDFLRGKTDKNGYFSFSIIKYPTPIKCFTIVYCKKKGYISSIPFYKITSKEELPKYTSLIDLKEGEKRKVNIFLEKSGIINGMVYLKKANDLKQIENALINIIPNSSNKIAYPQFTHYQTETDVNGNFYFSVDLDPSVRYFLKIDNLGYGRYLKEIQLSKGAITSISYTFDDTDNTGVRGIITINNILSDNYYVSLLNPNTNECIAESNSIIKDGKYLIKNVPPGKYKIHVLCLKLDKYKTKDIEIEIEKNIMNTINIDFSLD